MSATGMKRKDVKRGFKGSKRVLRAAIEEKERQEAKMR